MNVRRPVLDADKAIARLRNCRCYRSCPQHGGCQYQLTQVDVETMDMDVTIEGNALIYDAILEAIQSAGAVVHSNDHLISGGRVVERSVAGAIDDRPD